MDIYTYPNNLPGNISFIISGSDEELLILSKVLEAVRLDPYFSQENEDNESDLILDHDSKNSPALILTLIKACLDLRKIDYTIL